MESTLKSEILYRLKKIEAAVQRLITQNDKVKTVNDYYCTPWGMEPHYTATALPSQEVTMLKSTKCTEDLMQP